MHTFATIFHRYFWILLFDFKSNADPVWFSLCEQRCFARDVSGHAAIYKTVRSPQNNLAEADLQLTNKSDKAVAGSLLIFTLQALTWCLVQYAIKIFPKRFWQMNYVAEM